MHLDASISQREPRAFPFEAFVREHHINLMVDEPIGNLQTFLPCCGPKGIAEHLARLNRVGRLPDGDEGKVRRTPEMGTDPPLRVSERYGTVHVGRGDRLNLDEYPLNMGDARSNPMLKTLDHGLGFVEVLDPEPDAGLDESKTAGIALRG
jgi:hypothetical protein